MAEIIHKPKRLSVRDTILSAHKSRVKDAILQESDRMKSDRSPEQSPDSTPDEGPDSDPEFDSHFEDVFAKPPAWADTRPPLCDSLEWFHVVQGSIYHHGKKAYGLLLDGSNGDRTYMDDEIIITRIGGNSALNQNGQFYLRKNQSIRDVTVSSIMASQGLNIPIGVIIGDRSDALRRNLPHRYNVMDWFRVTDIWTEKVTGKTGYKVRLEKIDLVQQSWWSAKGSPSPPRPEERDFETKPEKDTCSKCSKPSLRVYDEGWMCLNDRCTQFWLIDGAAPTDLTFHATFLSYRNAANPKIAPVYELAPHYSNVVSEIEAEGSTIREAWRGIICPSCAQCLPRVYWEGWKCTYCNFKMTMQMVPIALDQAIKPEIRRRIRSIHDLMSPQVDYHSVAPYITHTYTLPGVGSITHFVANEAITNKPNGPNDMFRKLQSASLGLKRYPLSQTIVTGTMTAHFAVNYGMPYKYVVSVDSKGFDEASDDVLRALSRLSWATEKAVTSAGSEYQAPNELLILGYFEDMRIGFHDDGETSLGPTIATLSLGANSKMMIRMKPKYYHGYIGIRRDANGDEYNLLRDDPVLEGCKCEEERRRLKEEFRAQKIDLAQYDEARKKTLKRERNQRCFPPVLIEMSLKHGDLVVMHGADLQKFYEHSVIPDGKMRFALTARHIMANHVPPKDRKKGTFSLTPDQKYDGN